jgi:hypothetical protein
MIAVGYISLGSIEAVRPVFLIVMGIFLTLIAWRLARTSGIWTARVLIAGALMLGFGYAVLMPLYEAGVLKPYSPRAHYHGDAASILGWHVVKLVVMNGGWLLFGIGIAMHAEILRSSSPRHRATVRTLPSHESVA